MYLTSSTFPVRSRDEMIMFQRSMLHLHDQTPQLQRRPHCRFVVDTPGATQGPQAEDDSDLDSFIASEGTGDDHLLASTLKSDQSDHVVGQLFGRDQVFGFGVRVQGLWEVHHLHTCAYRQDIFQPPPPLLSSSILPRSTS